jgi:hypothetical protein
MNNIFLSLLERLQHIAKYDKTKLIIYSSISLGLFFFMEKLEFRKIALLILIFIGVFFYFNKESFINNSCIRDDNDGNTEINNTRLNTTIENKLQKMKITQPNLIQEVDIDKIYENLKEIEMFIKVNIEEIIQKVGNSNKNNVNLVIYKNLVKHIMMYTNQVEMVLENKYRKDKSLEKVRDIKREIFVLIHSLHFKVDSSKDSDITKLINKMKEIFTEIDDYLVEHINEQFYDNPTYQSGTVNYEKNSPRSYDETLDRECRIVEF